MHNYTGIINIFMLDSPPTRLWQIMHKYHPICNAPMLLTAFIMHLRITFCAIIEHNMLAYNNYLFVNGGLWLMNIIIYSYLSLSATSHVSLKNHERLGFWLGTNTLFYSNADHAILSSHNVRCYATELSLLCSI